MLVVEYQHELRRKRPHPIVHHHRIVDVELHTVIDIIERVVEIDDCLRLALRRVCTGVRTEDSIRIIQKSVRNCEHYLHLFTGSI